MTLIETTKSDSARGQFQTLRDELQLALSTDDQNALRRLKAEIARVVSLSLLAPATPSELAKLRAQLGRLVTRARRFEDEHNHDSVAQFTAQLEGHDLVLENAKVVAQLSLDAKRRSGSRTSVREQVLKAIGESARRPGDIAEELGCDPTQVSRALRELTTEGLVQRATPAAGRDGRAHWYELAPASPRGDAKADLLAA